MFEQDVVDALKKKLEEDHDCYGFEFPGAKVTEEEQQGGEDQGSGYYVVYKVVKDDVTVYVMASGYYDSYEGVDWSSGEVKAVTPYEKTVRAWR